MYVASQNDNNARRFSETDLKHQGGTMKFVSLLMSSLLLAACGGGGGGGAPAPAGPVASTSTFQLKQAYINDYTVVGAMPFKVSGFVNVNPNTPSAQTVTITGNGTETRGSQVSTTFAGQAGRVLNFVFEAT
jgi:hypothetical protein